MKFTVSLHGREFAVDFDEAYGKRTLMIDGKAHTVSLLRVEGGRVRFTVDDRPVDAFVSGHAPELAVDIGQGPWAVEAEETRYAEVRRISGLAEAEKRVADLKAPMPGLITRLLVAEGDRVQAGTPVLVMEAMKMENELRAGGSGTVAKIKVDARQPVEQGQVLVTFQ
jgi:biotin carboxyl carrier protein